MNAQDLARATELNLMTLEELCALKSSSQYERQRQFSICLGMLEASEDHRGTEWFEDFNRVRELLIAARKEPEGISGALTRAYPQAFNPRDQPNERGHNLADAYAYYTDCNFATLEVLASKKSTSLKRIIRQQGICAHMADVCRKNAQEIYWGPGDRSYSRVAEVIRGATSVVAVTAAVQRFTKVKP